MTASCCSSVSTSAFNISELASSMRCWRVAVRWGGVRRR
jgi:hypothetical protein